jgi:hypothetical protein
VKRFFEAILCFFVGHEPGQYLGDDAAVHEPHFKYRCHRCGKVYLWHP